MKTFSDSTLSWVINGVLLSLTVSAVLSVDSTPWIPYEWIYPVKCLTCVPDDVQKYSLECAEKLVNIDFSFGQALKKAEICEDDNFCDSRIFKEWDLTKEEFQWQADGEVLRIASSIVGSKVCCKNSKVVMTKEEFILWLQKASDCKPHAPCCKSKIHDVICDKNFCYRVCTGHCNNMEQTHNNGCANRNYCRLVPAAYDDGVSEIRLAKCGSDLPNARKLSFVCNKVIKHDRICPRHPNMLSLAMAEILLFDVSHHINYQPNVHTDKGVRCCKCSNKDTVDSYLKNYACLPINIPEKDKYLAPITCQNLVRTAICPNKDCSMAPINQWNRATSFIDASCIYGSSKITNELARTKQCSTLAIGPGAHLGDQRVKRYPHILVTSTCWASLHNTITSKLNEICTHWNHETTYHVARKIHNAIYQNIIYEYFLKYILSPYWLKKHDLLIIPGKDTNCFDPKIKPCTLNEFALIWETFIAYWQPNKLNIGKKTFQKISLKQLLWDEDICYKRRNEILTGMMWQAVEPNVLSTDLLNNGWNCKYDQYAHLLTKFRDHGIAPYIEYVNVCHKKKITCWEDLHSLISHDDVAVLKTQYKHVEDIDLPIGCAAEMLTDQDVLPPTVQCIVAYQARVLKGGDKLFYTNKDALTKAQLEEIRKFTIHDFVCSCGVSKVPKYPLEAVDPDKNPFVPCKEDCFKLDLSCFANEKIVEDPK